MPKNQNTYLKAINVFAAELIKARSINDIVWVVVQKAISTLKFHDCVVYLYDEEDDLLHQTSAFGPKDSKENTVINPISIKPGEGIVGSVFKSGVGEIVNNTLQDKRYIVDDAIRLSEMAIPIIEQEKKLGVIDCEHPDENFFTDVDFQILSTIAAFAATKIVQAKNDEKLLHYQKGLEASVQQKTKELNKRINELQKVNKELDQFAYIVAHDLKSPLKNIALLAQWIKEDIENVEAVDNEVFDNLNLLNKRVKRLDSVINGVLDYSKIGKNKLELELFNPKLLVLELLDNMYIPSYVTINTNKVTSQPTLLDKLNVSRIIQNLVENAIKYSDKEKPHIEIGLIRNNQSIEIFVKDNGPGIAPQYHERIFGVFQTLTTKDENESTGIGLAMVKKIVEENGANIKLTSDIGKGSIFSITWKSKEPQPA